MGELIKNQTQERKALPKRIRQEMKAREMMFRESMRISTTNLHQTLKPIEEKDRLKKFQEAEKKRYRAEQHRFEMKHQRQLEESRASSATAIKELEQLQNEKRKMLMEHETQKLRDLDDAYGQELREWKGQLKPRKQQFQEALIAEETAQAKYYQAIHDLKNSSKPFIQPKLTSSRSSLDNVSIKSAPTLTRSTSDIHPTPPMLRQKRRPKNYKLHP